MLLTTLCSQHGPFDAARILGYFCPYWMGEEDAFPSAACDFYYHYILVWSSTTQCAISCSYLSADLTVAILPHITGMYQSPIGHDHTWCGVRQHILYVQTRLLLNYIYTYPATVPPQARPGLSTYGAFQAASSWAFTTTLHTILLDTRLHPVFLWPYTITLRIYWLLLFISITG